MREIKFMAYIKHLKLLVDVDVVDFLEEEIEVTIEGDMHVYRFDEIELLQFTGLKDKNGREIYEGDIIPRGDGKGNIPVTFENGMFMWGNEPLTYDLVDVELSRPEEWAEVIGNIYENHDLLE